MKIGESSYIRGQDPQIPLCHFSISFKFYMGLVLMLYSKVLNGLCDTHVVKLDVVTTRGYMLEEMVPQVFIQHTRPLGGLIQGIRHHSTHIYMKSSMELKFFITSSNLFLLKT